VGRPQADVEQDLQKAMQRRLAPTRQPNAALRFAQGDEPLPEDEPDAWWERQHYARPSVRRRSSAADRQGLSERTKKETDA
jgi:hypothetical protein